MARHAVPDSSDASRVATLATSIASLLAWLQGRGYATRQRLCACSPKAKSPFLTRQSADGVVHHDDSGGGEDDSVISIGATVASRVSNDPDGCGVGMILHLFDGVVVVFDREYANMRTLLLYTLWVSMRRKACSDNHRFSS